MTSRPTLMARVSPLARRAWSTLLDTEAHILLWALGAVVGLWGFLVLADEAMSGGMHALDERLMRALRSGHNPADAVGPPWVESVVRDLTALGSTPVLILVTLAVGGWLLAQRRYYTLLLVLLGIGGGLLLSDTLKHTFQRPRPQLVPHLVSATSPSFPSGHAMHSAIVYLTLGALLTRLVQRRAERVYVIVVSSLFTVIVGGTRVYLGVHYPSDVLAGWTAGLAWALLCLIVEARLQKRGAVEAPR
jgi:undecaprenyl-diphosphatase